MKKLMHLIAGACIALMLPTQLLAQQDSTQIPAFSWTQISADTSLTFDSVVRYCDSMFALLDPGLDSAKDADSLVYIIW